MKPYRARLMSSCALLFSLGIFSLTACTTVVESPPPRKPGPPPWAPAHGYRAKFETYHYYPAVQVYYYPKTRAYYWLEGGQWKVGARLPGRISIGGLKRVVLELESEPHTQHNKIKSKYPPGY